MNFVHEKIAVISDTGCDLSDEFISQNGIKLIPFRIILDNGQEYKDKFEISAEKVIELLKEHSLRTSLPSIEDIINTFDAAKLEGYTHAIVLTISSKLSGTWSAINTVAKNYEGLKIAVVDSKILSMAQGFLVMAANDLIKEGEKFSDIVTTLEKRRNSIKAFFLLDTLEYLKKSGRMPNVVLKIAQSLNVKPIFTLKDGKITMDSISLGRKRGVETLKKRILKYSIKKFAVAYTGNSSKAREISFELSSLVKVKSYLYHIGPALSLHGGPEMLGIVIESD